MSRTCTTVLLSSQRCCSITVCWILGKVTGMWRNKEEDAAEKKIRAKRNKGEMGLESE